MSKPLVSICCITYNHAPFIRKCLDGFLMQQGVEYEILIHDDCSTDGTTEIIREYEAKYPSVIKPIYETRNQYTNPDRTECLDFFNYKRAQGKYIAYCEGDDYWTDPLKLKKQVDFMEANPEYSICWHKCTAYIVDVGTFKEQPITEKEDYDVTALDFVYNRGGSLPLTMMFRCDRYDFEWRNHYTLYLDTMETYHLLRTGKGRMMQFVGGQYNIHQGGICSSMKDIYRGKENCRDFLEMYVYTHDQGLLPIIDKSVHWLIGLCSQANDFSLLREAIRHIYRLSPMMGLKYSILFVRKWIRWKVRKNK